MARRPRNYAGERSLSAWRERARAGRERGRRDYEAETAVRVVSGQRRGFTRAEARGHPEESRLGVGVSAVKQIEAASAQAVESRLVEGPFASGLHPWTIMYVAMMPDGTEVQIDLTKGKLMTDKERDDVKDRLRRQIGNRGLTPPTVGTP